MLPITGYFSVNWGDGRSDSNITTHVYVSPGVYTINVTNTNETSFSFNNGGDKLKIINITHWGDLNIGNYNPYIRAYSGTLGCSSDICPPGSPPDAECGGCYGVFRYTASSCGTFYGCSNMNFIGSDSLNLTGLTSLDFMFYNATSFNGNITGWDTSSVITMNNMFGWASSFNQPIGNWNTSRVVDMYSTFGYASSFNQPIGNWNTRSVVMMNGMFAGAPAFNQNLSGWDTRKAIFMTGVFSGASAFNGNVSGWNTSSVSSIDWMFANAHSFNQPIGGWDMGKVWTMKYMFANASAFNQPIGKWNTKSVTDMRGMFSGVTLSTTNYDALLNGWASHSVQSGVTFDGGKSRYSSASVTARNTTLIANNGWTITDGGYTGS